MDAKVFMREDYLRTAFNMFDKDNSGKIDNEEVIALLQGEDLGVYVSKDAIANAMKEIDANGDGYMDIAIVVKNTNQLRVLRNDGTGLFQSQGTTLCGTDPKFVAFDDLDGDGNPDGIVAKQSEIGISDTEWHHVAWQYSYLEDLHQLYFY